MQRQPIRHLSWLLVLAFASCTTATQTIDFDRPNALFHLNAMVGSGPTAIEPRQVPLLHTQVPSNEPDTEIRFNEKKHSALQIHVQGERSKHQLVVTPVKKPIADLLVLSCWNLDHKVVGQHIFEPGKPHVVEITIDHRGVFLLTLDGVLDGKHLYRSGYSVGAIPDNTNFQERWKQSDYWLGICAFPGRYHWNSSDKPTKPEAISEEKAREIEADVMAKLGLSVARLDVSMVLPENEKTAIDWKRMDASVNAYTSRGFELALQLMHPPDWAMEEKYKSETKHRWRFPRREEPYRRYVREIVERYGKHAKFVQVYNEPDQPEFWSASPEEFVTELSRAREEIRKVLPKVDIANGGYAFIDPKRTEYFTQEFKGKTELQSYHSHGNLRELERDIKHMRQLHQAAGYDKPRYVNTECGYAAWRLDQERAQAASVVQKILYSWAHGDEGMLLFASRMTKAPGRSGRDFGFLDYEFQPRFVYGTVSALVEQLAGAKFERTLIESEDVHAYLFKRGQEWIVGYFSVGASRDMKIVTDAKHVGGFDAMGNWEPVSYEKDGTVSVKAGSLVKWLVLEGGMRVEVKKE